MIIRQVQLKSLSETLQRPFIVELGDYVRERYPESTWDRPLARTHERLAVLVQQALSFEITFEHDVARFVDFDYQLGEDFYLQAEFAWARAVLNRPDLSGTEKVERIYEVIHGLRKQESETGDESSPYVNEGA